MSGYGQFIGSCHSKLKDGVYNSEVCHPRCVYKLYGEVNSVKTQL